MMKLTAPSTTNLTNYLAYLLALIPFVVAPFWWYPFITGRLFLWCVATLCALFILWQSRHTRDRATIFFDGRLFWFGALVIFLLVRSSDQFFSAWWGTWIRSDGLFLLACTLPIMATLLATQYLNTKKVGIFYVAALVGGAVLSRFVVLAPGLLHASSDLRWSGTVGNALFFGTLTLFLPFMSTVIGDSFSRRVRLVLLTCALIITTFFLYHSGSRGTMLAIFLGIAAFCFEWMRQRGASWWKRGVAATVVFLFFCVGTQFIGGRAFNINTDDPTTQIRLQLYENAWQSFIQHPIIGYGYVGFRDAIVENIGAIDSILHSEQLFDSTHSFYIDLALAGGMCSLVLYAVWFFYVYKSLSTVARATFIAYHAALVTAPFQMWAMPAVILLIVCGQKRDVGIKKIEWRLPRAIFVVAGAALALSAAIVFISVPREASRMLTAIHFNGTSFGIVARAAAQPIIYFPFMIERDVLYAFRVNALLQNHSISTVELNSLRGIYLSRISNYIENEKIFVESLHTLGFFSQNFAAHVSENESKEWFARAEKAYRSILVRSSGRPATSVALAGLLFEQGRIDEVGAVSHEFVTRYPNSGIAQFYWAIYLETIGDHAGAVRHATRALELRPAEQWLPEQRDWYKELLQVK